MGLEGSGGIYRDNRLEHTSIRSRSDTPVRAKRQRAAARDLLGRLERPLLALRVRH